MKLLCGIDGLSIRIFKNVAADNSRTIGIVDLRSTGYQSVIRDKRMLHYISHS